MQQENSAHLERRVSLCLEFSRNAVQPKNDFAKSCALEDFFMHFSVAPAVAAFSTRAIDNDFAPGPPACGIKLEAAALQITRSMHGAHRPPHRPMHASLFRVDPEYQQIV